MLLGLLGKKLGMTQVNQENKGRVPVTLVEVGPCVVLQKKTPEKDGYAAVKLAFGPKKEKRTNKATMGQFGKVGSEPKQFVREFRVDASALGNYEEGQAVKISDVFEKGQHVDVSGTSKGRGFQGVVKKYGFAGQPRTHGTHEMFRHAGGVSAGTWPGRIWKNKKMPGQMGNKRVTTQNLEIVDVLDEDNCILVEGAVPGGKNGFLEIRKSVLSK